jgi:hypothetical protein
VSKERARQLRDRGLARLRVHARRHDLRSFRRCPDSRFGAVRRGQMTD